MLFEKQNPLVLLPCSTCKSTGFNGLNRCRVCKGMAVGHSARERWLFWDYPLTRYHLLLAKSRRLFYKIRFITVLVLLLTTIGWFVWFACQTGAPQEFLKLQPNWHNFLALLKGPTGALFWLSVILILFLRFRSVVEKRHTGNVEHHDYKFKGEAPAVDSKNYNSWPEVFKLARKHKVNVADTYTEESLTVLGEAYFLADKNGNPAVEPMHLFSALLNSNRVGNIFIRLGIPASALLKNLEPLVQSFPKTATGRFVMPLSSPDFQQILFQAYEEGFNAHQEYVSVTELLLATIKQSDKLQELLYDLNIEKQKLVNAVEWARIRERLYRQYVKFSRAAAHRSKKGMDKAMTAVQTPFLNQFSDDLTILAQFGNLEACVAREKEIDEVFRIIDGGGQSVLLVGDHGMGKRTIIDGIAQKMVEDDVPDRIKDKRLVRLSISSLLAGTTPAGAVDRLIGIMNDIARARNVILVINNLHELVGVSAGGQESSLDVGNSLAEYLTGGRFLTLATTSVSDFSQHISNSPLGNVFTKVEIKEMDENQAIQVLESKVGTTEYKQKVFFAYDAIAKCVQLASRFLHENYLPGSALNIMNEAAAYAHTKKGENALVSAEEVAVVVGQKTGIPVTTVTADETTKLLHLEDEMHKRVVGQQEAVDLVANALRRARAEIRSSNRPIANFLFLGPTGVGKTEMAKTIAEKYFGGENRMIRLDMSEYQDKSGIYRLIGAPNEKGTGILTEAVRRNPFALLLLDEIEKADKDILNLFLQVMDDGRLTDSTGHSVDFTNVILIATSNAGTSFVQEQMRAGLSSEAIKERLLHGELKQYFRPEFLNRFDGIVLFKPLTQSDIKQIAGLMFKRVIKDLELKGIILQVEDVALDYLSKIGFDPEFGARPMRRALQERVENKLAELLLSGKIKRKDTVVIGQEAQIYVK